jgi:predicted nucleic acid-binding protein
MDIVVDTSVIIASIADEAEKKNIISVTQGCSLIAPSSVHWEIGNAFSAMLKQKRVTLKTIKKALSVYDSIPIRYVDVDIMDSLELAVKHNMYAYDAYLLWCALQYKSPLLTLDKGLIKIAESIKVKTLEV